jgi:serine/threonine-protein kinase
VDLLSRNLDGAGALKTVSPTVVIRRWSGRADPASAGTLGRNTGAGLVVFGTLVAAGRDSVRLDAAILDVAQGKQLGDIQLRGESQRMDKMADSLSLALLRQLGRSRPVGAVQLAGLSGTSPQALKAFLQGEQFYRQAAWDSARTRYEAALALDSTLVPAMRHLAQSMWWSIGGGPAESLLARAGRLNRGLPPRDSLLVAADSIYIALGGDLPDTLWRALKRRYQSTLELATQRYPLDPEIWYMLGEARHHHGWEVGATDQQAMDAFGQAIALDSSFLPGYVHTLSLGLWSDGIPGWDRQARPYLARSPPESRTEGARVSHALLHLSPGDTARRDSILGAATAFELVHSLIVLLHRTDSAELAVPLARATVASPRGNDTDFLTDPGIRREFLMGTLAFRGHVREARRLILERGEQVAVASLPAELALFGGFPGDSAEPLFRRWLRERPLWPSGPLGAWAGQLTYVLPWWAGQRDTASLQSAAVRMDSAARASKEHSGREVGRYGADAARAYLALARHDTVVALAGLAALPHDIALGLLNQLVESRLLAARGRDREALAILGRELPWYWVSPLRVMWSLERARVTERVGDRERAISDYQYVADAWRHGDPEVQTYVQEARAGLQRLTQEPAR